MNGNSRAIPPSRAIMAVAVLFLLASCLALAGCGSTPAPAPPTPRDISFSVLASNPARNYELVSEFMVITNQDSYAVFSEVPEVDFDKSIVLGIDYYLPDSGYSFAGATITQTGTEVDVQIELLDEHEPTRGYLPAVVPGYDLLLIDRAAFDPGGELHFVLLDENGGQIGEAVGEV